MKPLRQSLVKELEEICSKNVVKNVSMAEVSNWRVGGCAELFVTPTSVQQLIRLRKILSTYAIPHLIIGNTTNLLFTDDYIEAVVIQIGSLFSDISIEGEKITAQAGLWVPKLARKAMQAGLTGLEHTCGIPGTLGGLVVMNGGSQRKGVGENITCVKTVDKYGQVKQYSKDECEFSYRSSIFQNLDDVIVEVEIELSDAKSKRSVHAEMLSILRERSKKFPRRLPNCGSVFVSNPAMYEQYGPPGKVIEECGLKGLRKGGALISTNHANFIINNGEATAEDVLYLINVIRDTVYKKTGYLMKVEPRFGDALGNVKEI